MKKTIIAEIAAMNFMIGKNWHSCGLENGKSYSLRIAWLKGLREDKMPYQATTTEQIKLLYQNQSNQEA